MLLLDQMASQGAQPGRRVRPRSDFSAPQPDRLDFEIRLNHRMDIRRQFKVASCRTVAEGCFGAVDFSQAMPSRSLVGPHGPAAGSGMDMTDRSLASFVSLLSISIRANAFAAGLYVRSLEVEAVMAREIEGMPGQGGAARKPGQVKVAVEIDADAPLSVLEALVANVAKWALAPAVTEFSGRFEIAVRVPARTSPAVA